MLPHGACLWHHLISSFSWVRSLHQSTFVGVEVVLKNIHEDVSGQTACQVTEALPCLVLPHSLSTHPHFLANNPKLKETSPLAKPLPAHPERTCGSCGHLVVKNQALLIEEGGTELHPLVLPPSSLPPIMPYTRHEM